MSVLFFLPLVASLMGNLRYVFRGKPTVENIIELIEHHLDVLPPSFCVVLFSLLSFRCSCSWCLQTLEIELIFWIQKSSIIGPRERSSATMIIVIVSFFCCVCSVCVCVRIYTVCLQGMHPRFWVDIVTIHEKYTLDFFFSLAFSTVHCLLNVSVPCKEIPINSTGMERERGENSSIS